MRDVSNRVYVSNRNIQGGKKDSFTPYVKEKINLHGNDHIQPIPKLEGHQKTNVPSVIVTNPITTIDISQVEKQIITSEAEKLKEEAKRIINEIKDYDSSDDNDNIQIRKHYKSHHHHRNNRDFETKIDEIQADEAIQDSNFGEIEEKRHKHSRHRHHH